MEWNESINNLDVEMDGCMPEKEKLFLSGGYYIKPFKYHKILEEILIELFTTSRACDEDRGGQHFIIHSIFHIIYFRTCQCDGTKMQREVQNKSDDTL